ncbi:hypothetical protein ACCO45_003152 [Purpureocillium lilacinum]|uniref:Uncharacterized protein n=1 Tax=Purpureocillium lilacinum TaxID=33203 RepID=A0ACC4E0H6_PURLI
MTPQSLTERAAEPQRRTRRPPPGVARDDSDDELGIDDLPWEWIYNVEAPGREGDDAQSERKRRKVSGNKIVGARMGTFECLVGDTVLLKADGSNEAWVAIVCEFIEDDGEGEKAANFMWFSTEKEIRNRNKKRNDFQWNELYLSPSWDVNPLASINGKATVTSLERFLDKFPSGKIPRHYPEFGKTFICRRGCNTRTATYTDEFVWEEVYTGGDDIFALIERVEKGTKAVRGKRKARSQSPEETAYVPPQTPTKSAARAATTPQSKRGPGSQKRGTGKKLEFTPLAMRKLSPSEVQSSPFQVARSRLHVSSVPTSLPCREGEFSLVYSHLEASITDGTGNCIYISGTPGTGKTATVREVIARLEDAVGADELDDFIFVEINGMKITDPHQSYTLLWEALKGQLMYNFFNWPTLRHSRLIVLAVANTMDLPERTLSNKISSRLGLTRITFPGYTHDQLMRIIQSRLEGVPGNIVDPDAIQFASRKVAAVSGDARRALDICRRAVELAEGDVQGDPTTPSKSGGTTPLLMRIRRTGLVETTFGETLDELQRATVHSSPTNPGMALILSSGLKGTPASGHRVVTRPSYVHTAALDLVAAGLINLEAHRAERSSKLRLAIADDEVKMALRDDGELMAMGIMV